MSNGIAADTAKQKGGAIAEALEMQDQSIMELRKSINSLDDKLRPALEAKVPSKPKSGDKSEKGPRVPKISSMILENNASIAHLAGRIIDITERLEI